MIKWISFLTVSLSLSVNANVKSNSSTTCILEDVATSGLGTVRYSILTEAKFIEVNGDSWALMKNQDKDALVGPGYTDPTVFDYLVNGENSSLSNLPTAGGYFLRIRNDDFSSVNPQNLKLGESQVDEFKAHNHNTTIIYATRSAVQIDGMYFNAGGDGRYVYRNATSTGTEGGLETRPKNITVNAFVKYKLGCIDSKIANDLEVSKQDIAELKVFKSKSDCDRCLDLPESSTVEQKAKANCIKEEVDAYEALQKLWTKSCLARTVGNGKRVLMLIGAANRTVDESNLLTHLDNEYPYYNVIETSHN